VLEEQRKRARECGRLSPAARANEIKMEKNEMEEVEFQPQAQDG